MLVGHVEYENSELMMNRARGSRDEVRRREGQGLVVRRGGGGGTEDGKEDCGEGEGVEVGGREEVEGLGRIWDDRHGSELSDGP